MIHISQSTADLLAQAGKTHWFVQREEKVVAKGKGEMTGYLIVGDKSDSQPSIVSGGSDASQANQEISTLGSNPDEKHERLIKWNTDAITRLLKEVVAERKSTKVTADSVTDMQVIERNGQDIAFEIAGTISLLDSNSVVTACDPGSITLDDTVERELRTLVRTIAALYRENSFHNFEHASVSLYRWKKCCKTT